MTGSLVADRLLHSPKGLPHTLPSKYFPAVDTGQTRHSRTIFLFQYRAIVQRAQRNMFLDVCLTICLGSLDRLLSASVRPVSEVTPAELLPALHPHPPQCVDDAPRSIGRLFRMGAYFGRIVPVACVVRLVDRSCRPGTRCSGGGARCSDSMNVATMSPTNTPTMLEKSSAWNRRSACRCSTHGTLVRHTEWCFSPSDTHPQLWFRADKCAESRLVLG